MKTPRLCMLVALTWIGSFTPAWAEDFLLDGPSGCVAIGGEWEGLTCLVHHLVIEADDTLDVSSGVYLRTDGPAYNYGRLQTRGWFLPNAPFNNRGTLITDGTSVPGWTITNTGTLVNRGLMHTEGGAIDNYGVFENEGTIETCMGPVVNHGYMHNSGYIDNWGASIVNEGVLVNDNRVYNPAGDYYILNSGGFENRALVENEGVFSNACGGAFYGSGTLLTNPVVYDPCDAGLAIQLLISRVVDAGSPPSIVLSKADVKRLTHYLGRASKELTLYGNEGAAETEVRRFIDDVKALEAAGTLPRYLAAAFVGWGERIVVILVT